ncbi:MAG: type III-B CRISPR module RAMP protein Cmr4 [Fimbriimonadaceae bacterium]|nr:type III-B CRISPR module RAMP protein Cmr4 [Fimbriimonadaceae bacterium]
MHHRILTLRTITPLHVGTGQSVGTTDLPIARERTTGWPMVPGSSVKGALKEVAREGRVTSRDKASGDQADKDLAYLFGSPDSRNAAAGALAITDLRCLLFPVRSVAGTFAYATSSGAIQRANELLAAAGKATVGVEAAPDGTAIVSATTVLKVATLGRVVLEDLDLTPRDLGGADPTSRLAALTGIAEAELGKRLAVLPDDIFTYLTKTATEVTTHVTLDFVTRTASPGMLRSEERVPSEAMFLGLAMVDGLSKDKDKATQHLDALNGKYCQFGGKGSVGNGLCRVGVTS